MHVGTAIAAVTREGDYRVAHHADGQVKARQVIVAVGRKPRVAGLSLESVGIDPRLRGLQSMSAAGQPKASGPSAT